MIVRRPVATVLLTLGIALAGIGAFFVLLTSHPGGEWWTLAALIVVVSVDTGAYATGLSFGKHPMAPSISPKKTWEGAAAGRGAAWRGGRRARRHVHACRRVAPGRRG